MLALSIRQPYVELILRGIKTIEYRSKPTKIVGERFWIYATKKQVVEDRRLMETSDVIRTQMSSDNLSAEAPLPWILELARAMRLLAADEFEALPRGLIVGSAVIEKVVRCEMKIDCGRVLKAGHSSSRSDNLQATTIYQWHLGDVEALKVPMKPTRHPQPIWFRPFEPATPIRNN